MTTATAWTMCGHDEAEAYAVATGRVTTCRDCGARVEMADVETDRPSHVALVGHPVRALARAIEEVGLALRVTTSDRSENAVREFRSVHPIARVMAERGTSTSNVTTAQVRRVEYLILHGKGRNAEGARRAFGEAFLRHCAETSKPSDHPEWEAQQRYDHDAARRYAARLAALPQDVRRVLVAVARGGASQGWPQAVARVESECYPAPVVTTYGEAGRPRRDRSQPTEAQVRTARAEALLTAALAAWEDRG